MSTRSAIIMKKPDGSFAGIYCHFDGYLAGVGAKLLEHYRDPAKVERLIALGDISNLGERVEPLGSHGVKKEEGTTFAYHRDGGETGVEAKVGPSVEAVEECIGHNGHVYVFADGAWTHNGEPLTQALVDADH